MQHQIQQSEELHSLERRVLEFIKGHSLIKPGDKVIVCVSGGPDSMALLYVLYNLRNLLEIESLFVAHFNHNLRPESQKEELFVKGIADKLALNFFSSGADIAHLSKAERLSIEVCGRKYRYDFFHRLKKNIQATKIATAHNANDRAEEFLLRLIRGSGPSGLSSLPVKTKKGVIRPLLCAYKKEIISYLKDKNIPYVVDSTNVLPLYQRNRIRLEVLPLLTRIAGRNVDTLLNRTADLICDEEDLWEEVLNKYWKKIGVSESDNVVVWKRSLFRDLHVALQRRLIRRAIERLEGNVYGLFLDHIESMRCLAIESISGKSVKWHNIVVEIEGDLILLRQEDETFEENSKISFKIDGPGFYEFEEVGLKIKVEFISLDCFSLPVSPNEAFMDAAAIKWPMKIRFWQKGDKFCPLGLKGKSKKLHDFFIDRKIPRRRRKKIPLLVDKEKICWVCGMMVDDRVKITDRTEKVLHVVLEKFNEGNP